MSVGERNPDGSLTDYGLAQLDLVTISDATDITNPERRLRVSRFLEVLQTALYNACGDILDCKDAPVFPDEILDLINQYLLEATKEVDRG